MRNSEQINYFVTFFRRPGSKLSSVECKGTSEVWLCLCVCWGVENGEIVSTNKWSKLKHGLMSHGDWPMSKNASVRCFERGCPDKRDVL